MAARTSAAAQHEVRVERLTSEEAARRGDAPVVLEFHDRSTVGLPLRALREPR